MRAMIDQKCVAFFSFRAFRAFRAIEQSLKKSRKEKRHDPLRHKPQPSTQIKNNPLIVASRVNTFAVKLTRATKKHGNDPPPLEKIQRQWRLGQQIRLYFLTPRNIQLFIASPNFADEEDYPFLPKSIKDGVTQKDYETLTKSLNQRLKKTRCKKKDIGFLMFGTLLLPLIPFMVKGIRFLICCFVYLLIFLV